MTIVEIATAAAPIALVVIGVAFFGWYKILKETNRLLKEQNAELKIANKELLEKHGQSIAEISKMQGQIDVLKSIPLVNIDTTLQKIAEFNEKLSISNDKIQQTNDKILATLTKTAEINAEDRDVLTNQNKHIATEVDKRMDEKEKSV